MWHVDARAGGQPVCAQRQLGQHRLGETTAQPPPHVLRRGILGEVLHSRLSAALTSCSATTQRNGCSGRAALKGPQWQPLRDALSLAKGTLRCMELAVNHDLLEADDPLCPLFAQQLLGIGGSRLGRLPGGSDDVAGDQPNWQLVWRLLGSHPHVSAVASKAAGILEWCCSQRVPAVQEAVLPLLLGCGPGQELVAMMQLGSLQSASPFHKVRAALLCRAM